ncbi:hypothetical protein Tco_1194174 [Tanacetum coccineum]
MEKAEKRKKEQERRKEKRVGSRKEVRWKTLFFPIDMGAFFWCILKIPPRNQGDMGWDHLPPGLIGFPSEFQVRVKEIRREASFRSGECLNSSHGGKNGERREELRGDLRGGERGWNAVEAYREVFRLNNGDHGQRGLSKCPCESSLFFSKLVTSLCRLSHMITPTRPSLRQ